MALPPVATFAYYLPQFYPVALNDAWWGPGYTEWSAVLAAHSGMRSPRRTLIAPGELGFYDLRSADTRSRQAELARYSGLTAFCIYHYWSGGERPLSTVVDSILADGHPHFPFFLCWANHDWTLSWKGSPNTIIWKQLYDEDASDKHIRWLLECFEDPRYFRIGGSPLLAVYDPCNIPHSRSVFEHWRSLAVRSGHTGLTILGVDQAGTSASDRAQAGVDAWIQSAGAALQHSARTFRLLGGGIRPSTIARLLRYGDYRISPSRLSSLLENGRADYDHIPLVVSSWNNVGRRRRGAWYSNPDPRQFQASLRAAFRSAPVVSSVDGTTRLVAINAWNEWGEAMAIEPTQQYGRAMLDVLRQVVDEHQ